MYEVFNKQNMLGNNTNMNNNIINCRKNRVASAVTIALMPIVLSASLTASFSAFSAETSDETSIAKKKNKEIEVIEVTSYRDSITSSLNAKRNANSVVDSITADDIGSFPDSNVAESLQRIPGISITRSLSGDGESVSIRGFGPGKNVSLVNGQQLSSSSFNLENSLSRGFNYGLLPSTIVQRAEVHKSTEAYLPEGGVGGTINIVTRKPLAQNKELLVVASGSASYNTLSEDTAPKASALVSWKLNDKFGALVSLDYSNVDTRRDAVEVLNYKKQSFVTADGSEYNDVLVPGAVGSANFNQNRERKTAMVSLQYQPSDAIDMNFNYLTSNMEGDNLNTNLISLNHAGYYKHGKPGTVLDATLNETTNTITSIDYAAPKNGRAGWASAIRRDAKLASESFQYDIKWLGDNLTLKAALGTSNSAGGAGVIKSSKIALSGPTTVSIDDGIGYVQYPDVNTDDLGSATAWAHGYARKTSDNDNSYIALDGEYYLDDNFITSVMLGVRYTEATQEQRHIIASNDYHKDTDAHDSLRGPASNIGALSSTPDDFLSGLGGNAISSYQFIDPSLLDGYGIVYTERAHQGNSYDVTEEIASVYAQANFEHDFDNMLLRGNFGLRYSDQNTETFNFSTDLNWKNPDDLEKINNFDFDFVQIGESSGFLPSVNLILDLQNDWVVRGAYSTVISRPAYEQLAQQLSVKDIKEEDQIDGGATRTAKKGNADLEAFEADKYDLSTEWYYSEGSSVSIGLFYYDIKTFVTTEESLEDLLGDGDLWIVTQPVNKDGGSVKGVEVALSHQFTSLPAPFDGLGIQANYTYVDSDTEETNPLTGEKLPLAGLSESTYNAVLFYSTDQWDARLSYNYRDAYYEQIQFTYPRFNDSIARLTAKVKYSFDSGLSLYLQGTNLTDQQNKRYIGDESRPYQTSEVGRNVVAGFDFVF